MAALEASLCSQELAAKSRHVSLQLGAQRVEVALDRKLVLEVVCARGRIALCLIFSEDPALRQALGDADLVNLRNVAPREYCRNHPRRPVLTTDQ
jgi:hypothetical protein